jgi:hypothetical protein
MLFRKDPSVNNFLKRGGNMQSPRIKMGFLILAIFCWLLPISYSLAADDAQMATTIKSKTLAGDLQQSEDVELPVEEQVAHKPFIWGDDATIATGSVDGGIGATYDNDFNQYAARCTTYNAIARNSIKVYKSADEGATWQVFRWFYNPDGYQYSLPQLLIYDSGTTQYLLVFHLRSDYDGHVRLAKYTTDGTLIGYYTVARRGTDTTITYYSACTDLDGDTAIVVFEVNEPGDVTPDLRCIRSTNAGSSWFDEGLVDYDGSHPDVAYGMDGYVYTVYQTTTDEDYDIEFRRSTNYGDTWGDPTKLMNDTFDDDYPKIAAVHTQPGNSAYVWATFNHDYGNSGNIDVRYVYSSNSGSSWSGYRNLASSSDYDEMASDLTVFRLTDYTIIHVSYLKRLFSISPLKESSNIYTAWTGPDDPTNWNELTKINDHMAAVSSDGRYVCQGTIMYCGFIFWLAGYVYAGKMPFPSMLFYDDLYFDGYCFTDVEDEDGEISLPTYFSLYDNYPNPFNPETQIEYYMPFECHVKLEIFNILGQRIRILVDEYQSGGENSVVWDGKDDNGEEVASGVYFYKLEAEEFSQTKKMVLIR